jgi:hypothetical protein
MIQTKLSFPANIARWRNALQMPWPALSRPPSARSAIKKMDGRVEPGHDMWGREVYPPAAHRADRVRGNDRSWICMNECYPGPAGQGVLTFPPMRNRHGLSIVLAVTLAAAGASPVGKSGNVYHKPVCPKSPGPQVMRCHALVVTDSKGNPIQTPPPLPNGKRPDR